MQTQQRREAPSPAVPLVLRKRTREHLHAMSLSREFLVTRYVPRGTSLSEINRLQATLTEVAQKVSAAI